MASLVADYGGSASEDEDSEQEESENVTQPSEQDTAIFNDYLGCSGTANNQLDEEDVDNDDYSQSRQQRPAHRPPTSQLLPRPNFSGTDILPGVTETTLTGSASVFANPFLAAEEAKNQLLEKHVKMTPTSGASGRSGSGNRHVCWNFRKGRCRFGQNCRFGHDSDLHLANRNNSTDDSTGADTNSTAAQASQQTVPVQDAGGGNHTQQQQQQQNRGRGRGGQNNRVARYVMNVGGTVDQLPEGRERCHTSGNRNRYDAEEEADESGDTPVRTKRKKPGLTNTLLPPKRSMKSYKQQQQHERPWLAK